MAQTFDVALDIRDDRAPSGRPAEVLKAQIFIRKRGYPAEFRIYPEAREGSGRPALLGLHIVMGPTAARKVANMAADIELGVIAPVEMICRAIP